MTTEKGAPYLAWRPTPFDHVLGDARLRDLKPELEQFAVDAWRAPKRIFDAHPPDQDAQLRLDLRSPSSWARLPTPVAAKSGSMPTHERLGLDDCENLQDCWKPAIQLDKEPAIMVREPNATTPHPLKRINRGASFIRNSTASCGVLPRPSPAKSQIQQIQVSQAMPRCRFASVPLDCA